MLVSSVEIAFKMSLSWTSVVEAPTELLKPKNRLAIATSNTEAIVKAAFFSVAFY